MPRNVDLDSAIRSLVAEEVEKTLAPYRDVLERFSRAIGDAPVRRGPGRPPRNVSAPAPAAPKRRRARRAAGAGEKGDVSKFTEGQDVKYRQGRGEFEATITRIDREKNVLTLARKSDGKKVERPPAKVYAA